MASWKPRVQGGNRKRSDDRVHRGRTQGGSRVRDDDRVKRVEAERSRDTAQEAADESQTEPTPPA